MDKNLEILKRLIIEAEAEEVETEEETEEVVKPGSFEENPMEFILKKYHTLNELLIELMTESFAEYIDGIFIMAPKPTTFKVLLHNGQVFFLSFLDPSYEATIEGKRYYLLGIGEKERCMVAISRLLRYGSPLKTKGPEGAEQGTSEEDISASVDTTASEEPTPEEGGETLTESIKILTRLLIEAKEEEIDMEEYIFNLLNKNKKVSEYGIDKIQKASGNNYKVYFQNVNTKDKNSRKEILKDIAVIKNIKSGEYIDKAVGWSSIGYTKLNTKYGEINISAKGSSENATTTNVKEGLVMSFYYSAISELITEQTFKKDVRLLISETKKAKAIDSELTKELVEYLITLENKKASINMLNQPLSQALAIKKVYPNSKYELNRGVLFNSYRSLANQVLGIHPDKWCPGDVYLVVNETEANNQLELASEQDVASTSIEVLNNAFNETWGRKKAPLTAISLKLEKAQGGKAKGYLQAIEKDKTKYNLTSNELEYDEKAYITNIKKIRKQLSQKIAETKDINYVLEDQTLKNNIDWLRSKFAALKSINFFLSQFSAEVYDDALLALAAFGMSLSDTSPAFFKLTASTTGDAEIVPYPRGASIALLEREDGESFEPITIEDSATFGGLSINMKISKGGSPYKVKISARSNGGLQGTIEISDIKAI